MLTRTITALLGFFIAIFVIRAGGMIFSATVLVLTLVALLELNKMLKLKHIEIFTGVTGIITIGMFLGTVFQLDNIVEILLVTAFVAVFLQALFYHNDPAWFKNMTATIFAIMYISVLFPHFILMREISQELVFVGEYQLTLGESFIWLVLLGTWASDTFAYFFGSAFGKRRLCPSVSPKKSVEGAVAGFIGCIAVIVLLGTSLVQLNLWSTIFLGLLVAIIAPLGDLAESLLKRYVEIKDSGKILPGHGGVLDRFDSLLFVMPLAYYYVWYVFIKG